MEPSLKPGDTIVVPATYGGIRSGCFDATSTELVQDCAEQAELFARARPVLRLHPVVVEKLGLSLPLDDPDEARTALGLLRFEWRLASVEAPLGGEACQGARFARRSR